MSTPTNGNSVAVAMQTAMITGSSMRRRASLAVQKISARSSAITKIRNSRSAAVMYPEAKKLLTPEHGELDVLDDVAASRFTRFETVYGECRLSRNAKALVQVMQQVERPADDDRPVMPRSRERGVA